MLYKDKNIVQTTFLPQKHILTFSSWWWRCIVISLFHIQTSYLKITQQVLLLVSNASAMEMPKEEFQSQLAIFSRLHSRNQKVSIITVWKTWNWKKWPTSCHYCVSTSGTIRYKAIGLIGWQKFLALWKSQEQSTIYDGPQWTHSPLPLQLVEWFWRCRLCFCCNCLIVAEMLAVVRSR